MSWTAILQRRHAHELIKPGLSERKEDEKREKKKSLTDDDQRSK
jgi:hypothetical protein